MLKGYSQYKKVAFITMFLVIGIFSYGQSPIKVANNLFKSEKYCDALKYYNKHLSNFADDVAYLKRGICNYHCMHFKKAIEDFNNSMLMGNTDKRLNLYLAKTYHHQQKFEKAIVYYKKYLYDIGSNKNEKEKTLYQIKRCANAIKLKYKPANHFIENWGAEINTPYNDILPIQSPSDIHHFYFSSDRVYGLKKTKQYKEFQVDFSDGEWEKLFDIFSSQNNKNTIFLDFFKGDKKVAYFLGPSIFYGSIFVSDYSHAAKQLNTQDKLKAPINAEFGFRHLQFINDSTIIFSSDKKGGYGGYDLYFTGIRDGKWFEPVNLGRKINSKFDEISPFVTKDGENLYFSSNSLNSIGGFDVFTSSFSFQDDDWSTPQNLGMPINSSGDEIGFRVLSSGKGGIFNSDRKDMGFGGQDLYWIYFKKLIDAHRVYAYEIPYLRNRHLKLIENAFEENEKDNEVALNEPKKEETTPVEQPPTPSEQKDTKPNKEVVKNKVTEDKTKVQKEKKQENTIETTPVVKNKPESKEKPQGKPIVKTDTKPKINKPKTNEINTKAKPKTKVIKSGTKIVKGTKSMNKKEKFVVPLIFIKDNKYRDNATVTEFIDKVAILMKSNPGVKVEFVGNAFEWQSNKSDLLNSVRITEGLGDSLILRMIEPDRIIIKGVGASLPAAKPYGPKRSKNIITKANNRIDVFFHNTKSLPVKIKNESLYISRSIEDARYKLYRTIIKGLTYKIQIKEGDFLFLVDLLKKYKDSSIEKDLAKNKYYYTVGLYKEYVSAKDLYKTLKKDGYNDIKIIPYIDGVRIEKKDILKEAKTYLDLVNYLEDNKK